MPACNPRRRQLTEIGRARSSRFAVLAAGGRVRPQGGQVRYGRRELVRAGSSGWAERCAASAASVVARSASRVSHRASRVRATSRFSGLQARNARSARSASPSIWLVTRKKDSGHPRLPYHDIAEEALCFGWPDSRPAASAPTVPRCWSHPRKPTSNWSRIKHPAGRAAVAAAQANGSWDASTKSRT